MSQRAESSGLRLGLLLFAAIAVMMAVDLVSDFSQGTDVGHIVVEGTVMALAGAGALLLGTRLVRLGREAERLRETTRVLRGETVELRGEATDLREQLDRLREQAEHWREEAHQALEGLGAAIDRQFERWGLTPAERDVGLLLLKGLSHKEVATARGVSERTVRQQARALYKKAGLSGRADLSAYFLEDLLLPAPGGGLPETQRDREGEQATKPR
jgi:DNA-binding CsgD family transcriptional regulator